MKVAKAMEWMTHKTKLAFKNLTCVTTPDFEKFCKKLAETFPEIMGDEKGLRHALNQIIKQFAVITSGE